MYLPYHLFHKIVYIHQIHNMVTWGSADNFINSFFLRIYFFSQAFTSFVIFATSLESLTP